MIGKWLQKAKPEIFEGVLKLGSSKQHDITAPYHVSGEGLPNAPLNPYKKRPLKLTYDRQEFQMFRLPSEQLFLLGSFDTEDLFGKRKGIQHSPHIKSQMDLDSNLLWIYFFLMVLTMGMEVKPHDEFVTLRMNFENHDMGRFKYEDFK